MNFIEITDGDGDQFVVNLDNVTVILPDTEDEDSTVIYFNDSGDDELKVKLSFRDFENYLKEPGMRIRSEQRTIHQ